MKTYEHERPALAVDCVVFGFDPNGLSVLLIKRAHAPKGWALPGGFVRIDESVDDAARRELREETGVDQAFLEQLYTFGAVARDPRERVVSVAYYALVKSKGLALHAATDAALAQWFDTTELPALAFDHTLILDKALERLRGKLRYEPIGFQLLPEKFTLAELQRLYELVLGRALDKRNFRKKIAAMKLLSATRESQRGVAHRAARLYRFDRQRYDTLKRRGFNFEI